jgi:ATP adenylyltransferase
MADSKDGKAPGPEILWAPWRIEYIENADRQTGRNPPDCNPTDCIFCVKPRETDDRANLIVRRGRTAFVIMNRYPYNNGHLMTVPMRHTADLSALGTEEKIELFDLLIESQRILTEVMKPHGFNIGMNLGRPAGAGIEDHLHFHIVPRWNGDTNFMPVLGHVKVVSEGLEQTWLKLVEAFNKQKR